MNCSAMLVLVLAAAGDARASTTAMVVGGGGGVAAQDEPGFAMRVSMALVTRHPSGFIHGMTEGYEYWRAGGESGQGMQVGGFAGTYRHGVVSTLGAGLGLPAFRATPSGTTGGIAPFANVTLGFDVGDNRTITFDARVTRDVMLGTDDGTRWSIAVSWGTSIGR